MDNPPSTEEVIYSHEDVSEISLHGIGMPELFITGDTKRTRAKNKTAQEHGRI